MSGDQLETLSQQQVKLTSRLRAAHNSCVGLQVSDTKTSDW